MRKKKMQRTGRPWEEGERRRGRDGRAERLVDVWLAAQTRACMAAPWLMRHAARSAVYPDVDVAGVQGGGGGPRGPERAFLPSVESRQ